MPTFDPTKPAANSPILSAELRNQLNALNDRLSTLETEVTGVFANANSVDTLTVAFSNPPTTADLEAIRTKLNELISALYN
jgi:hypothetical protein